MCGRAFTMLELIFVIIIVGILTAVILPRMDRDTIYEAAEQVLGHIKYTQHLAMVNDVYRDNVANWHFARWHINFMETVNCGLIYRIGSNRDLVSSSGSLTEDFSVTEAARDPLSNKPLYSDAINCNKDKPWHDDILLTSKYSITNNDFNITCSTGKTIAFDHLGRPYFGFTQNDPTAKLLKSDCNITMQDGNGNQAIITITPETGYSYITYN